MNSDRIIVINAREIIEGIDEGDKWKLQEWKDKCASICASFKKKTSRSQKNGKEYEYTNWYQEKSDGSLKSIGKIEPDYTKYYPPEPIPGYSFKFVLYEDHLILDEKDFNANQKLFNDCLAFRLDQCLNYNHPLYKNPQKAIDEYVNNPRSVIVG